jgi:hypothetical protein
MTTSTLQLPDGRHPRPERIRERLARSRRSGSGNVRLSSIELCTLQTASMERDVHSGSLSTIPDGEGRV